MLHDVLATNWHIFEAINGQAGHEPVLDPVMIFSASDLILLLPLLLLVLWFGLARWSPWSAHGPTPTARWTEGLGQRFAILTCLAVVIALALNVALGHILYEPRPFVSYPGLVHKLIAHPADASFPSDHEAVAWAFTAMFFVYLITLLTRARLAAAGIGKLAAPRRATIVLAAVLAIVSLCVAVLIGVARVYVGVHYPGDIAGGAGCGIIGALLATALRPVAEPVLRPLVGIAERIHLA